jgi:hypothetical protein
MVQVVEHLLSKFKTLSLKPSIHTYTQKKFIPVNSYASPLCNTEYLE